MGNRRCEAFEDGFIFEAKFFPGRIAENDIVRFRDPFPADTQVGVIPLPLLEPFSFFLIGRLVLRDQ